MNQQSKIVKGEYHVMSGGLPAQRIEIEIAGGFVVVKNVHTCEILLQCSPNKRNFDPRGIGSQPKYAIKIEIEAIN